MLFSSGVFKGGGDLQWIFGYVLLYNFCYDLACSNIIYDRLKAVPVILIFYDFKWDGY